ncbi:unannotated protein [freshwater metagenome]|uniref:Unannotated protein n=1 Tax=freshwater metagenome TaxID=449393 RepID=A0A6J6PR30_9ZZZZ
MSVAELIAGAQAGEQRDIARLISRIEDGSADAREAMQALAGFVGRAQVIGITGAPGWVNPPPPPHWFRRFGPGVIA